MLYKFIVTTYSVSLLFIAWLTLQQCHVAPMLGFDLIN